MDSMSKRDRTTLGGLVLAMIVGVGGSLALAASCLGRDKAHRGDDDTTMTTYPEDRSARTSSGGVPGEEAIGTTEITSVELPAGAPTNAPPPTVAPAPAPAAAQTAPRATAAPTVAPNATSNTTVNVHVNRDGVTTTTTTGGGPGNAGSAGGSVGDGGTTTTEPASTQEPTDQNARDGGGTSMNGTQPQPQSTAPAIPPRPFKTEPNAFGGASTWTPNHEAGAGPFTTERNIPDNPGP